jgi:quercetin dioxygenase-like cupin family protein
MSQNRQTTPGEPSELRGVVIAGFPMPRGTRFNWHTHEHHQLAWASNGVLRVSATDATWVLPPTRALSLWIPAQVPHEVSATEVATMTAAYLRPEHCAIDWTEPTPVRASPVLRELIGYLSRDALLGPPRAHAELVLVDLLEPVDISTVELRPPSDARALEVALAIQADPADRKSLAQWGFVVGTSARTLAREFLADTGLLSGSGAPWPACKQLLTYWRPASRSAMWRAPSATTPRAHSSPRFPARPLRRPGPSSARADFRVVPVARVVAPRGRACRSLPRQVVTCQLRRCTRQPTVDYRIVEHPLADRVHLDEDGGISVEVGNGEEGSGMRRQHGLLLRHVFHPDGQDWPFWRDFVAEALDVRLAERTFPGEPLPGDGPGAIAMTLSFGDLRKGAGKSGGIVDGRHALSPSAAGTPCGNGSVRRRHCA